MTDGQANKDEHLTMPEADLAKRQGIELYGIGMYQIINQQRPPK